MHPRKQARLFGKRAGDGALGFLLQLAQTGKLEAELARRVLRSPESLKKLIQNLNTGS